MSIDAAGFNRAYYLARNPDVLAAGLDPWQHYLQFGWREGRNPNPLFDVKYYLATYRDVAAAQIDPLAHYLQFGWREGRNPNPLFDVKFYLATYGDVAAAQMDPLTHYLLYGQREFRDTSAAFSPRDYLFVNSDVRSAGLEALEHYLDYGLRERRKLVFSEAESLSEGFDRDFYRASYGDVAASGLDPYVHYQGWGNREGRAPNALFDKQWYLARNPDVAAAKVDALTHFLNFGWREGRDPSAIFSIARYREATGFGEARNPLLQYLQFDRTQGLPFGEAIPQIIQARGSQAQFIFVAPTDLAIGNPLTRVTSPGSPLDGRDLAGYTMFLLERSSGDINFTGNGRFPTYVVLGPGNDSITGTFTLSGQISNFFAGGGTLTADAIINDGSLSLNAGRAGSNVTLGGTAAILFNGSNGPDTVRTGDGADSFTLGSGVNSADGGPGIDFIYWTQAVFADLASGRARSLTPGLFDDTFINIEALGGSPFDDILLGDNANNRINGTSVSPGSSGNDILVGRGGDDSLIGGAGADVLIGGSGADQLVGFAGNDILIDGADGWGGTSFQPQASGGPGEDIFVHFLGAVGEIERGSFAAGGPGADRFVIDTSRGRWTSLGIEFSQIDGDKIDVSMVRTGNGAVLTLADIVAAASSPFFQSVVIDLARFEDAAGNALSGRLVINGVFSADELTPADFIFSGGTPWQSLLPPAVLPEYLI